jgi:hypothetical protein
MAAERKDVNLVLQLVQDLMDAIISQRTTPFKDFGVLVVCSLVYLNALMYQGVEIIFVNDNELLWWAVRYYPHLMKSFR